jgi:hypothetical protein
MKGTEAAAKPDCSSVDATKISDMDAKEPASLSSLAPGILSEIAECLARDIKFASMLELRLANKDIGDCVARILELRAARVLRLDRFLGPTGGWNLSVTCVDKKTRWDGRRLRVGARMQSFKQSPYIIHAPPVWSAAIDLTLLTRRLLVELLADGPVKPGCEVWVVSAREEDSKLPAVGLYGSKQEVLDFCLAQMPKEINELWIAGPDVEIHVNPNCVSTRGLRFWTCQKYIVQPPTPEPATEDGFRQCMASADDTFDFREVLSRLHSSGTLLCTT